jgi:hypothetical protein
MRGSPPLNPSIGSKGGIVWLGEVVRKDQVVERDNVMVSSQKPLLGDGSKHETSYESEALMPIPVTAGIS